MKFRRTGRKKVIAAVDMAPLIDVVFLLLIFFLLTSSFVTQTTIPLHIPSAEAATLQREPGNLVISLLTGEGGPDNLGRIALSGSIERDVATWDELTAALGEFQQNAAALPPMQQPMVLVRADRDVTTQRLIDVLSRANSVGIENYGIAAAGPAGAE